MEKSTLYIHVLKFTFSGFEPKFCIGISFVLQDDYLSWGEGSVIEK